MRIDRQLRQQREHYHRVKGVRWKFFSLRVEPGLFEELQAMAARNGMSVSEAIRCCITWTLEDPDV